MGIQASMEQGMQRNTENMIQAQQRMGMRQREMMMAMQIAQARDFLRFYAGFAATVAVGATAAYLKKGNVTGFFPLVPLSFGGAYQYDMCYGSKMVRVRNEAAQILDENWRLGEANPFLLPENNLLMDKETYLRYTRREE